MCVINYIPFMQSFIIVHEDTVHEDTVHEDTVHEDTGSRCQAFEVTNMTFVNLKELQQPPSSNQLWYRKDAPDGSFVIVSMGNGRALKCDQASSQVVLCDVREGDLWVTKGSSIVCKRTSQLIYADSNKPLYCDDEIKMNKKMTKSFKFQKVVCRCSNYCCHG